MNLEEHLVLGPTEHLGRCVFLLAMVCAMWQAGLTGRALLPQDVGNISRLNLDGERSQVKFPTNRIIAITISELAAVQRLVLR